MNAIDESLPLPIWTQSAGEEVANGISHGIGLVGAMIGTPILLLAALHHGNIPFLIGTIIFTTTMLLVYLVSTLYHCWPRTHTKSLLQVLDHSAIFLLIAGTVHAICLGSVTRRWRVSDARDRLGTRASRRHHESNPRRAASSETCDDSLSRNRLDRSHLCTSARAGNSVIGPALFNRRWDRLHSGHFIFRERAAALWPFRLASVRACRH